MAAKVSTRAVLNRKALTALQGSFVDAFENMGETLIARTHPPDAEPYGEGLVTRGDWGVWVGTKKVAGTAQRPRAHRLIRTAVTMLVGFGFPARFQEIGTAHQPARPFFTPVVMQLVPGAGAFFRESFRKVSARYR